MVDIEKRLKEKGISIPQPAQPVAAYVPGVKTGDLIFVSGQLPVRDGQVLYKGKIGQDISLEEGQQAARICAINCLAVVKSLISDWDALAQVVKITGYVQSGDEFYDQAKVLNGASELIGELFDEAGKHSRAAVGVKALPLNAACEVEMIVRVK